MPDDARTAILTAARLRFSERGFAATSMEEIRTDASVSNGSLFHHFPTKNHLARALYLEALGAYHRELAALLGPTVPAAAGVRALATGHIAWVTQNRRDARILVELRGSTTVAGDEVDWKKVNADVFGTLRAWIASRVEAGDMRDLPSDVWMALVFAPVLQLTPRWAKASATKVAPAVVEAFAAGAVASVTLPGSRVAPRAATRRKSHAT